MRENLYNPEIKLSSRILLLIMILFLLSNYFLLELNFRSLKRNYVEVLGAVTAKIIESDASLEKVIVPMMTRPITEEAGNKGKEILQQYGLSENLENFFFPYMNKTIRYTKIIGALIFVAFSLTLLVLNLFQYGYFYRYIRRFSAAARKIVEGEYDLKLSEEREGDLSKLAVAFNSMGDVIRNHIHALKKEKQFLADMLSDISHQLKTPLSSMILYNDIMLEKNLSEEQRRTFLLSNQKQLSRMHNLLYNLLKLAKLDADAVILEKEEQNLFETLEEALEILEGKAQEGKVEILLKGDERICFNHDRLWLQEAIINIVKNAIEHTPEGGKVTIQVSESPVFKRIIIQDTGEGISEADIANIFKRFYKTQNAKKSDSVGIGLSIAKSIIERHGGFLEVESKENVGTKFSATFLI